MDIHFYTGRESLHIYNLFSKKISWNIIYKFTMSLGK